MKNKLEVGQVLFGKDLKEYKINRVGRKYFYVSNNFDEYKYLIEKLSLAMGWGPHRLYVSKEGPQDEIERQRISRELTNIFSYSNYKYKNLTLAQLRAIEKIINDDKPDVQTKN